MLLSGTGTFAFHLDLGCEHWEAGLGQLFVLPILCYHSLVVSVVRSDFIEVVLGFSSETAKSTKDIDTMWLLGLLWFLYPRQSCMACGPGRVLSVYDSHRVHFSVEIGEGFVWNLLSFSRFPETLNPDPGTKTEIKEVPIVERFFLPDICACTAMNEETRSKLSTCLERSGWGTHYPILADSQEIFEVDFRVTGTWGVPEFLFIWVWDVVFYGYLIEAEGLFCCGVEYNHVVVWWLAVRLHVERSLAPKDNQKALPRREWVTHSWFKFTICYIWSVQKPFSIILTDLKRPDIRK